MYYPQVEENNNTRSMISQWLGYNHNERISDGEFYDMENLSTTLYPVLSPREVRPKIIATPTVTEDDQVKHSTIRGALFTDGSLAYVEGNVFHYDSWSLDLTKLIDGTAITIDKTTAGESTVSLESGNLELIRFGAYILIFQLSESVLTGSFNPIYVNLEDGIHEAGLIAPKFTCPSNKVITYTLCSKDGAAYENPTVSETEPENPESGDYWICTKAGAEGLYIYINSSWNAVATTYVKISVPDATLSDYFAEGDVVFMNNIDDAVADLNDGMLIEAMGDDYIVVTGIISETVSRETNPTGTSGWTLEIERKVPNMDYICVDKNRVWGCKYGYIQTEGQVNEIYCCKLGDFKNWYSFQGLSTDSYSLSLGVSGAFTGCISYGGYPTFFKEDHIFRIYGSYPAEYSLTTQNARGVQRGSGKSLAIVGETLYYKSTADVMAYDGSTPVSISKALGTDYYSSAIAGAAAQKYYIEMTDELAHKTMLVYDADYGLWTKESEVSAKILTGGLDGQIYGITDNYIFRLGRKGSVYSDDALVEDSDYQVSKEDESEQTVEWYAITGDMGLDYADYKYVSRITVRAYIPFTSEVRIEIAYDNKAYQNVGIMRGIAEIQSYSFTFPPFRCDHFKIRLTGHGSCKIYSMAVTQDTGSEEHGYSYK